MLPPAHDDVISYEDPRVEDRKLYDLFQPFPRWERIKKEGAFALSAIICAIMALAAINGAFFKLKAAEVILWIGFGSWIAVFFAYAIAKVVMGRKKSKLFAALYPRSFRRL